MSTKSNATPHEQLALQIIDTWLSFRIRHVDTPGIQICVRKKGKVIFSKAYGVSNTITGRSLETTDLFHIASHSKMFTACAILMLQEQGKLNITDKLVKHLPALRKHADARFKDITVRDLLTHRAGLFRDGLDINFWSQYKPFPTRNELIKEVLSADLVYEPGTQTKYSNFGYGLLGLIIEKVTGKTYAEAIDALIFKKIKTKRLRTDYTEDRGLVYSAGHSKNYAEQGRLPFKHAPANALAAATGFCGTADDTSLFLYEYLYGEKLLSLDMRKELLSLEWPVVNATDEFYGLGLQINKSKEDTYIGHSGGYMGSLTQTRVLKQSGLIVSILSNSNTPITMAMLRFITLLLAKLKNAFDQTAIDAVSVSPILMTPWNEVLYVVGKNKALRFNVDAWNPIEGTTDLKHIGKKQYMPEGENGYSCPDEAISFVYKNKQIVGTRKYREGSLTTEAEFFKTKWPSVLAD